MNSVVQALFYSIKFRNDVLLIDENIYVGNNGCCVMGSNEALRNKVLSLISSPLMQLQKAFAYLLKSSRPYIIPKGFRNALPDYLKRSFMQQDASEFFKVLSELLVFDAKRVCTKGKENIFSANFENRMKTSIKCVDCQTKITKEEKFVDLFIPIDLPDDQTYYFAYHSIDVSNSEILFKKLLLDEVLENDNAYYCEKCNTKSSKAIKSSLISHLGNNLIFTANRFYYNTELKQRLKKMNVINFPKLITIPDFITEIDKTEKCCLKSISYELYAIVVHSVKFKSII